MSLDSFTGKSGAGGAAGAASAGGFGAGIEELRRQFALTQENLDPFIQAGVGALPDVIQGTSAAGLDERLAQIFDTDIFGSLVGERQTALQGQLGASGQQRSGLGLQEAANVPTSLGLALEDLLTGRSTNLAASGQNAAIGLGGIGQQNSGLIANLLGQQGQAIGSGILTDQQAKAEAAGQFTQIASSIFFSDPALKKNVGEIAEIGDLNVYQWDWITPEGGPFLFQKCGTIGFLAHEVKEKYPQHVGEYGGFMVIDYPALLDELESEKWPH